MDTLFERQLARKLEELKQTKTDLLTQNVLSPAEYQYNVGYFKCLTDVQSICDQVRDEIQNG